MNKKDSNPLQTTDDRSRHATIPDHSPKTYTIKEQSIFAVKLFFVVAAIITLLWLIEKYT